MCGLSTARRPGAFPAATRRDVGSREAAGAARAPCMASSDIARVAVQHRAKTADPRCRARRAHRAFSARRKLGRAGAACRRPAHRPPPAGRRSRPRATRAAQSMSPAIAKPGPARFDRAGLRRDRWPPTPITISYQEQPGVHEASYAIARVRHAVLALGAGRAPLRQRQRALRRSDVAAARCDAGKLRSSSSRVKQRHDLMTKLDGVAALRHKGGSTEPIHEQRQASAPVPPDAGRQAPRRDWHGPRWAMLV